MSFDNADTGYDSPWCWHLPVVARCRHSLVCCSAGEIYSALVALQVSRWWTKLMVVIGNGVLALGLGQWSLTQMLGWSSYREGHWVRLRFQVLSSPGSGSFCMRSKFGINVPGNKLRLWTKTASFVTHLASQTISMLEMFIKCIAML